MLLLALIGGIATGALTGNGKAGLMVGGTLVLLALFVLYMNGKEERARVESELETLPAEEREYWTPALDNPDLFVVKLQERLAA